MVYEDREKWNEWGELFHWDRDNFIFQFNIFLSPESCVGRKIISILDFFIQYSSINISVANNEYSNDNYFSGRYFHYRSSLDFSVSICHL